VLDLKVEIKNNYQILANMKHLGVKVRLQGKDQRVVNIRKIR